MKDDVLKCIFDNIISSESFEDRIYTREELYKLVKNNTIDEGSFEVNPWLPSDYCYNRRNKGIEYENHLHIFEYCGRNKYRILGSEYHFTGNVEDATNK